MTKIRFVFDKPGRIAVIREVMTKEGVRTVTHQEPVQDSKNLTADDVARAMAGLDEKVEQAHQVAASKPKGGK